MIIGKGKYQIDMVGLKSIAKKLIIFYTPIILMLLDQLEKGNIDLNIVIISAKAMTISAVVVFVKKLLTDYNK